MKKAEQHKMPFAPFQVNNGAAQPTVPVNNIRQVQPSLNSDPSSTFRSSRYPVPSFDFRGGAAQ